MTKEPTITELLAGLADLEQTARQTGFPQEVVTLFQRTRERIRYLGSTTDPGPSDQEKDPSLASPEELPDALADLIATGLALGAPTWATNLLCSAHMRLANQLSPDPRQPGTDKRVLPRFEDDRSAQLIRASGSDVPARIVDHSPLGLGLLIEAPLDPHELVRVRIANEDPQDSPLGEVVFCQQRDGESFHAGVELLAPK